MATLIQRASSACRRRMLCWTLAVGTTLLGCPALALEETTAPATCDTPQRFATGTLGAPRTAVRDASDRSR